MPATSTRCPRPATILVHADTAEIIRRAETIDDVFGRDVIPPRLASGSDARPITRWRVTGLDHVAVSSGDLERSLRFYHDLLGLPIRDQGETSDGEIAEITGIADARVRWADLRLPNQQILELLQYLSPAGTA